MKVNKYACFTVILEENWFRLVYISIIFSLAVITLGTIHWFLQSILGIFIGLKLGRIIDNFQIKYNVKLNRKIEFFLFVGIFMVFANIHLVNLLLIHWSLGLL